MASRPSRFIGAVLPTLAVVVCLGAARPDSGPTPDPSRTNPDPNPNQAVAVVAVDGADWRVIDELVAAGRLPAFARLRKAGTQGILKADPPRLSPIAWTTVATGRPPEEHGILDSMVDGGDGSLVPVHAGARRVKAAWEIWSEASRSVLVLGWPVTWPADRVRGMLASDRLAAGASAGAPAAGLVHPPEALEKVVRGVVAPSSLDAAVLSPFGASASSGHAASRLRAGLATARSWRAITARALETGQPGLVAVCFELVDTVSHLVVRDRSRGEVAIAAAYQEVDAALADLAARLHPATLLVVLSAHGFYGADAGIREDPSGATTEAAAWHRPYGIFAAADAGTIAGTGGPGLPASIGLVSPLDVLPTLLARAGLPVAADMPGRVLPNLVPAGGRSRLPTYGARGTSEPPKPAEADKAAAGRPAVLTDPPLAAGTTPLARLHLAEILHRKGDHRGAIRELEAAGRQDPLGGRVLLWLARCRAALGRTDEALRDYDGLVSAKRASVDARASALLEATTLTLRAGRLPAALERVDRAPSALDRAPAALIAQGDAAEAEGRRQVAERSYRTALNVAPSDADAAGRLVDLLIADGRADTARVLAARLAQAYPSSPQHLALAGRASLAVKSHAEAARWFELALALAPDDPELLARLETARKR